MLVLALDTSTRIASIALCTQNELLSEYTWFATGNHSVDLFAHLQQMTAEHGISLQEIDLIATALGPGSFNGLRVAVATAKALAFSLKKPLVGISTLELIAAQQQHYPGLICATLEAGRGELYAACYIVERVQDEGEPGYHPRQLGDNLLVLPQQLAASVQEQAHSWFDTSSAAGTSASPPPSLFCGEISEASRQALRTALPGQSLFVGGVASTRHASTLAALALQRLHQGKEDDPLVLEPLYLRRPSITTSTRKRPLLGHTTSQRPAGQSTTEREEGALRH